MSHHWTELLRSTVVQTLLKAILDMTDREWGDKFPSAVGSGNGGDLWSTGRQQSETKPIGDAESGLCSRKVLTKRMELF